MELFKLFWEAFLVLLYLPICLLITVFFHELSHMLVAMAVGVKVERFCIGFGKAIWKKTIKGIEFCIAPIPFGGYVKMEGEDTPEKPGWLKKRYSKKLAILLAGVTANLIIAIICYLIQYKSIKFGLWVDWNLIKATLFKDHHFLMLIMYSVKPNLFLLQLSVINLACFVTNLFPIPALDGGYIWTLWLEKIYKERFPYVLKKINAIFFVVLTILQLVLLYYIFFV